MPQIINPGYTQTRNFGTPMQAGEAFDKAMTDYRNQEMAYRQADAEAKWKYLDWIDKNSPGGLRGEIQGGKNPYIANLLAEAVRSSGLAGNRVIPDAEVAAVIGAIGTGQLPVDRLVAMAQSNFLTNLASPGGAGSSAPAGSSSPAGATTPPSSSSPSTAGAPVTTPAGVETRSPSDPARADEALFSGGVSSSGAQITPAMAFNPFGGRGLTDTQLLAGGMTPFGIGAGSPTSSTGYTPGKAPSSKAVPEVAGRFVETPEERATREASASAAGGYVDRSVAAASSPMGREFSKPLPEAPAGSPRAPGAPPLDIVGYAKTGAKLPEKGAPLYDAALQTTAWLVEQGLGEARFDTPEAAAAALKELAAGNMTTRASALLARIIRHVPEKDRAAIPALVKTYLKDLESDYAAIPADGKKNVDGKTGARIVLRGIGEGGVPAESGRVGGSMSFVAPDVAPAPSPTPTPTPEPVPGKLVDYTPPADTAPPAEKTRFFYSFGRNVDAIAKTLTSGGDLGPRGLEAVYDFITKAGSKELADAGMTSVLADRAKGVATDVASLDLDPRKIEASLKVYDAEIAKAKVDIARAEEELKWLPFTNTTRRMEVEASLKDLQYKQDYLSYLKSTLGKATTAGKVSALEASGLKVDDITKIGEAAKKALESEYEAWAKANPSLVKTMDYSGWIAKRYAEGSPAAKTFAEFYGKPTPTKTRYKKGNLMDLGPISSWLGAKITLPDTEFDYDSATWDDSGIVSYLTSIASEALGRTSGATSTPSASGATSPVVSSPSAIAATKDAILGAGAGGKP